MLANHSKIVTNWHFNHCAILFDVFSNWNIKGYISTYFYTLDTYGSIRDIQSHHDCRHSELSSLGNFHAQQSGTHSFQRGIPHTERQSPIGPLCRTGPIQIDETRLRKQLSTGRVYTTAYYILHTELGVGTDRHSGNAHLLWRLDTLMKTNKYFVKSIYILKNKSNLAISEKAIIWNPQRCFDTSWHFLSIFRQFWGQIKIKRMA